MRARQALILTACMLAPSALVPAVARAVPSPNGGEFKVSSCDSCRKRTPSVGGVAAGATAGSFVMTWESRTAADPVGISARFFTKAGAPKSPDLQVNKEVAPMQHSPAVAVDAKGGSIVVWSAQNGFNSDVLAQRYAATGAASGAAFVVNVDTPGAPVPAQDIEPAVAFGADGGFVISWIRSVPPSAGSDGEQPAVMARRYNAAGAPLGAPVKLNMTLVRSSRPEICVDTTGRAVIAYVTVDGYRPFEPNKKGIALRRLTPTGALSGSEVSVAQPLSDDADVGVACGLGGTFVVVWSTDQAPAVDGMDIVAQRYTTLARKLGSAFRVNATTAGQQEQPAMFGDAAGNFTVAWQSRSMTDNKLDSIYARRFLASGTADGSDLLVHLRVNALEDRAISPDVANLGAAGFVVVWAQGNAGLQARRYKLTP
jgi:hypothetical protein